MRYTSIFKKLVFVLVVCCLIVVIFWDLFVWVLFLVCGMQEGIGDVYETDDISNYGKVLGNTDNEAPKKILDAFLPKQIEQDFSDVTYHYKALKGDSYACEIYLAFTIQDQKSFSYFKTQHKLTDSAAYTIYSDQTWDEYTYSDYLLLRTTNTVCAIGEAKVLKVFVSEENQRIVFWALLVRDGGYTTVNDLNYIFSKYEINPLKLNFAEVYA